MSSLRKQALAWLLGLTALAVSAIGSGSIVLHEKLPTDAKFVETHLESARKFDVPGARKANYSDQEIADFVVKINQAEFDRQWHRLISIVGALYLILALGICAVTLNKEAAAQSNK